MTCEAVEALSKGKAESMTPSYVSPNSRGKMSNMVMPKSLHSAYHWLRITVLVYYYVHNETISKVMQDSSRTAWWLVK